MGYLMAQDSPFSTAFYAAMLISLVLARKIDNFAFATGTVLAVATFAAMYSSSGVVWLIAPVVVFLVAGFVDEVADGMVDKYDVHGAWRIFLNYRPFSDLALLAMVLAGVFPWMYFLPYFSFTASYLLVERFSEHELGLYDRVYDRVSQLRTRMPRLGLLRPFR